MNEGYPLARLGEFASVQGGFAFKSTDFKDSGIPVLKIKNVRLREVDTTEPAYVDESVAEAAARYLCKTGDLLISMTGSGPQAPNSVVGRVARFIGPNDQFLINQRVGRFLVKAPDKLDQRYLFYVLAQDETLWKLVSIATGSANQANISGAQIESLEIPLPPLPEQKAIAHILGTLDDKIELNRRMNATLDAMARALFQSWFVDFDPVRAKLDGRPPAGLDEATAALFPAHLEESSIGKKPVGWELTTLETVLSVLETGGRPKGGVSGITSGVPSIGAESIVGIGQFDFGKTKFVPVEFFEGMRKGRIESHDVLLYKDGGRPGEYEPHVSMFGDGFPFEKCSINEHVYRLRANERLSQEYLYFWLTSELAFAEMRIKGTGVAIPGLNSTAVRSLAVLVPPRSVIEAFTRQTAPLVTRILANSKQSRTLAVLRDALLPKLLSGEIRLKG